MGEVLPRHAHLPWGALRHHPGRAVSPPRGPTGVAGSGMFCLVLWATLLQPRASKDKSLSILL